MNKLQLQLIPPDKKIHKFSAILEIVHQTKKVQKTLIDNWDKLNDDSKWVYISLVNRYNDEIPVGNYGGLYEGLDYLYHQYLKTPKKFNIGQQLINRERANNSSSKVKSTMTVLFQHHNDFDNYFVSLADNVRKAWNKGKVTPKYLMTPDENICKVMRFVLDGRDFHADNSELAVSKAILDERQTSRIILENPQFKNHEEDRTKTILQTLKEYHNNKPISTTDHRQAWSIICKGYLEDKKVTLQNPLCITKSFPNFFRIIPTLATRCDS